MRFAAAAVAALTLATGCAHFPSNARIGPGGAADGYSFAGWDDDYGDAFVAVALSGGGARAAALAFGVMEAMHATRIGSSADSLLQEVDVVSSISGGSIAAAYWAVHGREKMLEDFSEDFLEQDLQGGLTWRLFSPVNWFRLMGERYERGDLAADYLDEVLFDGATFRDLLGPRDGEPFFLISATDGSWGTRFDFTQDTFDALCSDLGPFPVARAVTASGAVPVASSPITVANFGWAACQYVAPAWVESEMADPTSRERLRRARAIASYGEVFDGEPMREWTHLVDGGLADNLGLAGLYDVVFAVDDCSPVEAPSRIVVVVVDSVLELDHCPDFDIEGPDIGQTVAAFTNITIDRLSDHNSDRLDSRITEWVERCTVGEAPAIDTVFIRIPPVADVEVHEQLQAETGLSLDCESVDALRCAGREVFRRESIGLAGQSFGPIGIAGRISGQASACARPDQRAADRALNCDFVQPLDDTSALNKDTPDSCRN